MNKSPLDVYRDHISINTKIYKHLDNLDITAIIALTKAMYVIARNFSPNASTSDDVETLELFLLGTSAKNNMFYILINECAFEINGDVHAGISRDILIKDKEGVNNKVFNLCFDILTRIYTVSE